MCGFSKPLAVICGESDLLGVTALKVIGERSEPCVGRWMEKLVLLRLPSCCICVCGVVVVVCVCVRARARVCVCVCVRACVLCGTIIGRAYGRFYGLDLKR